MNVHGYALCFMVMGPSRVQRLVGRLWGLVVGGWWHLAVGGSWRLVGLVVGGWRLVAVGIDWWLVVPGGCP